MTKPMVRIHNIETDEVIDREMNDEEFKTYQEQKVESVSIKNEEEAKATAKAALLDKLGISADEAALLLG